MHMAACVCVYGEFSPINVKSKVDSVDCIVIPTMEFCIFRNVGFASLDCCLSGSITLPFMCTHTHTHTKKLDGHVFSQRGVCAWFLYLAKYSSITRFAHARSGNGQTFQLVKS